MGLATVTEGLRWIQERWDRQQPVPLRIHTLEETPASRTTDRPGCECLGCGSDGRAFPAALGSPDFTHSFTAVLDAAGGKERVTVRSACTHPNKLPGTLCVMCAIYDENGNAIAESGVYERTEERFRYPMTRALRKLRSARSHPGEPHPLLVIRSLAAAGWERARLHWTDDQLLRAIRQLEGRYAEAPAVRSWTGLSESQQNAEMAQPLYTAEATG